MTISSMMKWAFSMLNIICTCQAAATYIKLADVLEVLVQRLHHVVDELQKRQLVHVVLDVDAHDEVQ